MAHLHHTSVAGLDDHALGSVALLSQGARFYARPVALASMFSRASRPELHRCHREFVLVRCQDERLHHRDHTVSALPQVLRQNRRQRNHGDPRRATGEGDSRRASYNSADNEEDQTTSFSIYASRTIRTDSTAAFLDIRSPQNYPQQPPKNPQSAHELRLFY